MTEDLFDALLILLVLLVGVYSIVEVVDIKLPMVVVGIPFSTSSLVVGEEDASTFIGSFVVVGLPVVLCVSISTPALGVVFPQSALVTHGLSRLPEDRVGRNLNTEGTVTLLSCCAFPSVLVTAVVVEVVSSSILLAVNSHTETSSSLLTGRAVEGVNLAKGSSVAFVSFAAKGETFLTTCNFSPVMFLDKTCSDFSFDN